MFSVCPPGEGGTPWPLVPGPFSSLWSQVLSGRGRGGGYLSFMAKVLSWGRGYPVSHPSLSQDQDRGYSPPPPYQDQDRGTPSPYQDQDGGTPSTPPLPQPSPGWWYPSPLSKTRTGVPPAPSPQPGPGQGTPSPSGQD